MKIKQLQWTGDMTPCSGRTDMARLRFGEKSRYRYNSYADISKTRSYSAAGNFVSYRVHVDIADYGHKTHASVQLAHMEISQDNAELEREIVAKGKIIAQQKFEELIMAEFFEE